MVSFALLLTFATAALAAPRGRNLAQRVAGRQAGTRQSLPMQQDDGPTNQTDATYSTNWAGAVLVADSAEYTSVTGTFTVPSPSLPDDALIGAYSASAWVGIDGDTCDTAILQTGVDFTIHALTGAIDYDGWYEWYPDYAYDFDDITFSSGDVVTLTVTATTKYTGTAVIENTTTGQTVSKTITSTSALCEENAEWIVEDYEEGDALVNFADFGTVTFTDAEATTSSDSVGPSDATIIDIRQDLVVMTSVSVSSDEVTITYV